MEANEKPKPKDRQPYLHSAKRKQAQQERLAKALRENLFKRKAQMRGRQEQDS